MSSFIKLLTKLELSNFSDSSLAYKAFLQIIDGECTKKEIKTFLQKINNSGINTALLHSAAQILNERSIKLRAPDNAIDVCGTGGDKLNTFNISTAVSFVVAACGVPVAKHGNRAVSSKSGSADIFTALGIDFANYSINQIEESLFENNIAFIFAPNFHPALKSVATARKELGIKTIFNYLGPLLNPANTKYQLIGCSDSKIAPMMLEVCRLLNKKRCWVVHGEDGMDEISITANSTLLKMDNQQIIEPETFYPEKYLQKKFTLDNLIGGVPDFNAKKMLELLQNKIDDKTLEAYHEIVSLNSAAALIIAGKAHNFEDGISLAKEAIASQSALNLLNKLIKK